MKYLRKIKEQDTDLHHEINPSNIPKTRIKLERKSGNIQTNFSHRICK
jgi:hypothetical protein